MYIFLDYRYFWSCGILDYSWLYRISCLKGTLTGRCPRTSLSLSLYTLEATEQLSSPKKPRAPCPFFSLLDTPGSFIISIQDLREPFLTFYIYPSLHIYVTSTTFTFNFSSIYYSRREVEEEEKRKNK